LVLLALHRTKKENSTKEVFSMAKSTVSVYTVGKTGQPTKDGTHTTKNTDMANSQPTTTKDSKESGWTAGARVEVF